MLIAVISDTHRMEKYINLAKDLIKDADILIHLGDNVEDVELLQQNFNGDIYAVKGNCDYSNIYPKERIIEIKGKKIYITHGDLYGVKYGMNNIYYKGKEVEADVVLFGHTHQPIIEKENNMILMNPGSISLPRSKNRTIAFIHIKDNGDIDTYLKDVLS